MSVLPKITKRDADGQAQNEQDHTALGCSGHRNDVVQAHHQVGNQNGAHRCNERAIFFAFALALIAIAQQLGADPQQQQAAHDLKIRQRQQLTATTVSTMRKTTAAPEPKSTAFFCCATGRLRAAKAITTALSPERMMLIQTILSNPSQKPGSCKNSMPCAP
jgi:hypothetical protein